MNRFMGKTKVCVQYRSARPAHSRHRETGFGGTFFGSMLPVWPWFPSTWFCFLSIVVVFKWSYSLLSIHWIFTCIVVLTLSLLRLKHLLRLIGALQKYLLLLLLLLLYFKLLTSFCLEDMSRIPVTNCTCDMVVRLVTLLW